MLAYCIVNIYGGFHVPHPRGLRPLTAAAAGVALFGFVAAGAARQAGGRIDNAVPDVARPFPLAAVRLTGGPLKRAQDLDAAYLLSLEPDRMLAFYRTRAGLERKAPPYDGWDGDDRNLTGPAITCRRSA
jgi:hypothetical protein